MDWILLVLVVSRVDFIVFVLFLEAVGVREYHTSVLLYGDRKPVGSSVLRAFTASNACFARNEPSSRVGGVGLEPKAAKATFVTLHSAETYAAGERSRNAPR